MDSRLNIFISYAHEDSDAGSRIATFLQSLGFKASCDRDFAIG